MSTKTMELDTRLRLVDLPGFKLVSIGEVGQARVCGVFEISWIGGRLSVRLARQEGAA